MGRPLTDERKVLKEWAIILSGLGESQDAIAKRFGVTRNVVKNWIPNPKGIVDNGSFILDKKGDIVHNSGLIVHNFKEGLPPNPKPDFYVGKAENLFFLADELVDIIITSPPYNLGQEKWPMGGNGRTPRESGVGYSGIGDDMPENEYQVWQINCLNELYRLAKKGASLFYNHKVRQREGRVIHPLLWIKESKWQLRQEVIWDRLSTHNHVSTLFWPQDERIYWLTKSRPNLPDKSINMPSIWREFGPIANTNHPAPFTSELPKMILKAVGKPGDIVLDPFGGGMTTCRVASMMAYKSIGIDVIEEYVKQAADYFGVKYWTKLNSN